MGGIISAAYGDGNTGHYGVQSPGNYFIYSESSKYQDLFWIETLEDTTVVYKIGSVLDGVTKDELVKIAETME